MENQFTITESELNANGLFAADDIDGRAIISTATGLILGTVVVTLGGYVFRVGSVGYQAVKDAAAKAKAAKG